MNCADRSAVKKLTALELIETERLELQQKSMSSMQSSNVVAIRQHEIFSSC